MHRMRSSRFAAFVLRLILLVAVDVRRRVDSTECILLPSLEDLGFVLVSRGKGCPIGEDYAKHVSVIMCAQSQAECRCSRATRASTFVPFNRIEFAIVDYRHRHCPTLISRVAGRSKPHSSLYAVYNAGPKFEGKGIGKIAK